MIKDELNLHYLSQLEADLDIVRGYLESQLKFPNDEWVIPMREGYTKLSTYLNWAENMLTAHTCPPDVSLNIKENSDKLLVPLLSVSTQM